MIPPGQAAKASGIPRLSSNAGLSYQTRPYKRFSITRSSATTWTAIASQTSKTSETTCVPARRECWARLCCPPKNKQKKRSVLSCSRCPGYTLRTKARSIPQSCRQTKHQYKDVPHSLTYVVCGFDETNIMRENGGALPRCCVNNNS